MDKEKRIKFLERMIARGKNEGKDMYKAKHELTRLKIEKMSADQKKEYEQHLLL